MCLKVESYLVKDYPKSPDNLDNAPRLTVSEKLAKLQFTSLGLPGLPRAIIFISKRNKTFSKQFQKYMQSLGLMGNYKKGTQI